MRCHIVKNTLLHIAFSAILPAGILHYTLFHTIFYVILPGWLRDEIVFCSRFKFARLVSFLFIYLPILTQQPGKDCTYKTGKKFMLCLDVSGSMTWKGCYGCDQLTPAVASFALAMVTWNIEDDCKVFAFGGTLENIENRLKKDMTIDEAVRAGRGVRIVRSDKMCCHKKKLKTNGKVRNKVQPTLRD